MPKCDCGRENKRAKSGLCGTCYARKWRSTLTLEQRRRHSKKTYDYNIKRPEWRKEVAERYRLKTGRKWPSEFIALFKAAKNLEQVLAQTKDHSPTSLPD